MDLKKQKILRYEHLPIEALRPTQSACGWMEVQFKAYEIEIAHQRGTLEEYLTMNTVPVVRAQDGSTFMLDKHHFLCALYTVRHKVNTFQTKVKVIQEMEGEVLPYLEEQALLHLYDHKGEVLCKSRLPHYIWDLQDDPMRSLAGFARKAGAFDKSFVPYSEFAWANYLRDKITPQMLEENLEQAIIKACELCVDEQAKGIAGYHGNAKRLQVERLIGSLAAAKILS